METSRGPQPFSRLGAGRLGLTRTTQHTICQSLTLPTSGGAAMQTWTHWGLNPGPQAKETSADKAGRQGCGREPGGSVRSEGKRGRHRTDQLRLATLRPQPQEAYTGIATAINELLNKDCAGFNVAVTEMGKLVTSVMAAKQELRLVDLLMALYQEIRAHGRQRHPGDDERGERGHRYDCRH